MIAVGIAPRNRAALASDRQQLRRARQSHRAATAAIERDLFIAAAARVDLLGERVDMGFIPAVRRIVGTLPKNRQTMRFSATLEASVAHLVTDHMRTPVRVEIGSVLKPSENVRIQAFQVSVGEKLDVLQRLLAEEAGRLFQVCTHQAQH